MAQAFLGSLAGLLGALDVDLLGTLRRIHKDGDTVVDDLRKSLGHSSCDPLSLGCLQMKLSVLHCHDHVFVVGQNTELPILNGKDQILALSLVKNLIAGYDL